VRLGGDVVPRELLARVRPKPGTRVYIASVPAMGGGQKNPLRFVLMLAVAAAAFFLPPLLPGATTVLFGAGASALTLGSVYGAAIFGIGNLLINAFIPATAPKLRDFSASAARDAPTLAIQGIRNRADPYGVVPRVYGKIRVTPKFGAKTFTEIRGKDQWIRTLFDLGPGPLDLSDLRIGRTKLEEYDDVDFEIRQGFEDDDPLTLYTRIPQEKGFQILLAPGNRVQQTSEPDADELSIDLTALQGLTSFDSSGDKLAQTIEFDIEFAPKDSGQWQSISQPVVFGARLTGTMTRPPSTMLRDVVRHKTKTYRISLDRISGKIAMVSGNSSVANPYRNKPICRVVVSSDESIAPQLADERTAEFTVGDHFHPTRVGMKIQVGAGTLVPPDFIMQDNSTSMVRRNVAWKVDRGQYDIAITRLTPDPGTDNVFDDIHWTALRSFTNEAPVAVKGHALVALEIRATDQLNGIVDEFNCIAESILWDFDGQEWVERPTANPAAVFRDELMSPSFSRKPVAQHRIYWPEIETWAVECRNAGREFNHEVTALASRQEQLRMVTRCGRADLSWRDGRISVVRDRVQTVPVDHITPRNSWGFRARREFPKMPHGFRATFRNREKDWEVDERIVPFDGYTELTASDLVDIELPGITDPAQVFLECRYREADLKLRSERFFCYRDFEGLTARHGALVEVTHDVILVGIRAGRIKSLTLDVGNNVLGFTSDEALPMEPGKVYGVSIRTAINTKVVRPIVTVVGENSTITFVEPFTEQEAIDTGIAPGDLFGFGETGLETMQCLVKAINRGSGLDNAKFTLCAYNPAVLAADADPIPPFESKLTQPSQFNFRAPAKPEVESVRSDEEVLVRAPDGSLESRVLIVLARSSTALPPAARINVRFRRTDAPQGAWHLMAPYPGDATEISVAPVDDKVAYDIELQAVAADTTPSEWKRIPNHLVIGKSSRPPDITTLMIETTTDGRRRARWAYPSVPKDHRGFIARRAPGNNRDWDTAQNMSDDPVTGTTFDLPVLDGTWTIMVKAVDTSGNESLNAAVAIINLGGAPDLNILFERDYGALGYPGSIVGGTVTGGEIRANDSGEAFWTDDSAPFWTNDNAPFWTSTYEEMSYAAKLVPGVDVAPARLRLKITATASSWSVSYRPTGSQAPMWDTDNSIEMWSDPSAPMWDPAPDFVPWPGEIEALQQQYEFRVITGSGAIQGVISALIAVLDVHDIIEVLEGVAISAAGTRLPITLPFRHVVNIVPTLNFDGGNAVNIRIKDYDAALGPLVEAINGAAPPVAVTGNANFAVQGY
jgi:predicted phage tail protein